MGKEGWPWTEQSPQLSAAMPNGLTWPAISIVTPSYNQGTFIEETIRSVLLQGYPDLDYIIIDGKSNDRSTEIIKKYEPWLTYWVSEPDKGQADAINKGFRRANGEILGWLNSDDTYFPGTLESAASELAASEDRHIIFGDCLYTYEDGSAFKIQPGCLEAESDLLDYYKYWEGRAFIPQPATFFRASALAKVGLLDESLHGAMDFDLWLRISKIYRLHHIPQVLATWRLHSASKTVAQTRMCQEEYLMVSRKHWGSMATSRHWKLRLTYLTYPLRKRVRQRKDSSYANLHQAWNQAKREPLLAAKHLLRAVIAYPPFLVSRSSIATAAQIVFGQTAYQHFKRLLSRK